MNEIKMSVKEAIEQLNDLKRDREGFAENDEPDSVFAYDIKAIDVAITVMEEKLERDKGCEYCAEDKCRLCTLLCDYWGDGGTDKCSADGTDDPCAYYNLINYCPKCGRRLVNEEEVLKDEKSN